MVSKKKVSIFALSALDLMKLSMGIDIHYCFIYGGSTPSTGQCPVRFRTKGIFLKRGESGDLTPERKLGFPFRLMIMV